MVIASFLQRSRSFLTLSRSYHTTEGSGEKRAQLILRESGLEMNTFNFPRRNIQKERRARRAEKRKLRSSAATLKVSCAKKNPSGTSGKKTRRLQKRWRQAQKEALRSGLVTMHDIEMMAVDEEGGGDQTSSKPKLPKTGRAFLMKKRAKLRLKSSSSKGKQISDPVATSNAEGADAMVQ